MAFLTAEPPRSGGMSSVAVIGELPTAIGEVNSRSMSAFAGASLGFLIGPTSIITPAIGLFMVPVGREFGLDRATFPLLMLMAASLAGLCSPLAGRAIDRFGIRRVIIPTLLLSALAQIALSLTTGSLAAFIIVMATVGILAGMQNPIGYTKLLALWFGRKRGLMIALAAAIGSGGGGVIVPQMAERFIAMGGWQYGYRGLGLFILLGFPLVFWLLREPQERKLRELTAEVQPKILGIPLREAAVTAPFWMILVALMLTSFSASALAIHVPAWAFDASGLGTTAAAFLSLLALGSIAGQIGSGFLLDRVDSAKVGSVFFFLACIGAVLLLVIPPASRWVAPDGFLIGMSLGAELGLASYLVSRFFGLRAYGQIYGCIYGSMVIGAGFGTVLMGVAYELTHTYLPAFAAASGALLTSALLILALPKYRFAIFHER